MDENISRTMSIEDIVKMIENEKLVLPEFQRDFKWPIEKTITLFDSLFQDLFIGSLIISKPKFDLACKGFDLRERGSKRQKPKPQPFTAIDFETKDIYTLLDGQQRTTAIYRALKGKDKIYLLFKDYNTLLSPEYYNYSTKEIIVKYDDYVAGFDTTPPNDNSTLYVQISDLYASSGGRESKFQNNYIDPIISNFPITVEQKDILVDYALTLFKDFLTDILKRDKLLSVQLLNMGLEKFCLYFERSNSQGLNLSFTDIITAKVYIDFKLAKNISEATREYPYINDGLVDSIVRYINFKANNDVTKKSILKDLKGSHFKIYWDSTVKDLNYVQDWLISNFWLFGITSMPYKTMLLPLLSFYQNLPKKEFSQASQTQLNILKFWFYSSIFDNRYGGGSHGSTNVVIKKDCEILADLGKNKYPNKDYWQSTRINYSFDELLKLDSNGNAKFMAIQYYMWSKKRFCNFENDAVVNINANIEVHHVFPSSYIKTKFGESSNEYDISDSILNKVRINKISNIKISNKAPSIYLNEIKNNNSNLNLAHTLGTHYIGDVEGLINGDYDDNFQLFLKKRYEQIEPLFIELSNARDNLASGNNSNIWDSN